MKHKPPKPVDVGSKPTGPVNSFMAKVTIRGFYYEKKALHIVLGSENAMFYALAIDE